MAHEKSLTGSDLGQPYKNIGGWLSVERPGRTLERLFTAQTATLYGAESTWISRKALVGKGGK
jgi:hypothetical protein